MTEAAIIELVGLDVFWYGIGCAGAGMILGWLVNPGGR